MCSWTFRDRSGICGAHAKFCSAGNRISYRPAGSPVGVRFDAAGLCTPNIPPRNGFRRTSFIPEDFFPGVRQESHLLSLPSPHGDWAVAESGLIKLAHGRSPEVCKSLNTVDGRRRSPSGSAPVRPSRLPAVIPPVTTTVAATKAFGTTVYLLRPWELREFPSASFVEMTETLDHGVPLQIRSDQSTAA
jgi:hypothetical protein